MTSPPRPKRRRKDDDAEETAGNSPEKLSPVVAFAHGAGAPSTSDWMIRWKEMLGKALNAVEVVTFDYPYMSGGERRPPPKAEKLIDFHADIVKQSVAKYPGHPLILIGKSMGSRVSSMVACKDDVHASAIICLGYPLKAKGVREEILLQLSVPIMFVQGSKDALCPLEKLEATRKKMKCLSGLHVVDGGEPVTTPSRLGRSNCKPLIQRKSKPKFLLFKQLQPFCQVLMEEADTSNCRVSMSDI